MILNCAAIAIRSSTHLPFSLRSAATRSLMTSTWNGKRMALSIPFIPFSTYLRPQSKVCLTPKRLMSNQSSLSHTSIPITSLHRLFRKAELTYIQIIKEGDPQRLVLKYLDLIENMDADEAPKRQACEDIANYLVTKGYQTEASVILLRYYNYIYPQKNVLDTVKKEVCLKAVDLLYSAGRLEKARKLLSPWVEDYKVALAFFANEERSRELENDPNTVLDSKILALYRKIEEQALGKTS